MAAPAGAEQLPVVRDLRPDPVADVLRERGTVDLQLLVGGLLLGTLLGLGAGRWYTAYPRARGSPRDPRPTAFQMSCRPTSSPSWCLWFFWNTGDFALPFVSGQGDYVPFSEDPLGWAKAIWVPGCAPLPLAAFVARMTEASMRDVLDADYIRTARAKGLPTSAC